MIDTDNNIDVMYFHGTTVDGCRFTIAGVIEHEDLVLGAAICSETQQFSKEKGRTISSGRVLNQRKHPKGRIFTSLYNDRMGDEYRGKAGYPEHYYVGKEIKVFRAYVINYKFFTKRELQQEFGLLTRIESPKRSLILKSSM